MKNIPTRPMTIDHAAKAAGKNPQTCVKSLHTIIVLAEGYPHLPVKDFEGFVEGLLDQL